MKTVTLEQAVELIQGTNGKIFSAVFTKKDGTNRHMNCRIGVSKGVKGVGRKFNPKDYNLFGVYDMASKGFRMINLKTLKSLQIEKETYIVVE